MNRSLIVPAAVAALLLTGGGVALADTPVTGPGTAACAQAGAAVNAATTLLGDKATRDKASDTEAGTKKALTAAQTTATSTDPYLTATDAATVAARIKVVKAYIADQSNTAANIALAQKYLVADQALADAITAEATAAATLADAELAYQKAGGAVALGKLAEAGGVPTLQAAQAQACAVPPTTTPPAPTTVPPTTTAAPATSVTVVPTTAAAPTTDPGSSTVVTTVPVGSVNTGWA